MNFHDQTEQLEDDQVTPLRSHRLTPPSPGIAWSSASSPASNCVKNEAPSCSISRWLEALFSIISVWIWSSRRALQLSCWKFSLIIDGFWVIEGRRFVHFWPLKYKWRLAWNPSLCLQIVKWRAFYRKLQNTIHPKFSELQTKRAGWRF